MYTLAKCKEIDSCYLNILDDMQLLCKLLFIPIW